MSVLLSLDFIKLKYKMAFIRRMNKELKIMSNFPPKGCSAAPVNANNLGLWEGTIEGPEESPYEGGKFKLEIVFGGEYPFNPPKVKFLTNVYHPNINDKGEICMDILKGQWSPALTIDKILLSIQALLQDPNPDDPLTAEIAVIYKEKRDLYNETAKLWTEKYAKTEEKKSLNKILKSGTQVGDYVIDDSDSDSDTDTDSSSESEST